MNDNVLNALKEYNESKISVEKIKNNLKTKVSTTVFSLILVAVSSLILLSVDLPVFLLSAAIIITVPEILTYKKQGGYIKNIKALKSAKKKSQEKLKEFIHTKSYEEAKNKNKIKVKDIEITEHEKCLIVRNLKYIKNKLKGGY